MSSQDYEKLLAMIKDLKSKVDANSKELNKNKKSLAALPNISKRLEEIAKCIGSILMR